jgi:hypothetical protein
VKDWLDSEFLEEESTAWRIPLLGSKIASKYSCSKVGWLVHKNPSPATMIPANEDYNLVQYYSSITVDAPR